MKYSLFVLLILLKVADRSHGDCILSLQTDFGTPSPVYLLGGEFLIPNTASGAISVRRGAALTVACPQRTVAIAGQASRKEAVDAKCVTSSTFSVGRWTGEFKQLNCSSAPVFTVKETNKACYSGGQKTVKVGYTVRDTFHELYTACFDRGTLNTLYVKHEISPSSVNIQSGHNRPKFTGGDLFPRKVHIEKLYKTQYEKDRFNQILGPGMADQYFGKNQFLTRGHLAPRADFSLAALQRATFHLVNVAPQWMRGNRGDWGALEEALRRRVKAANSTVTVYTGTRGVLALPGARGAGAGARGPGARGAGAGARGPGARGAGAGARGAGAGARGPGARGPGARGAGAGARGAGAGARGPGARGPGARGAGAGARDLYLYTDENNNVAVPVPLYFYKLVHDPRRRAATAFVTINSSFFSSSAEDALTFCDEPCPPWLTWRDDATRSFCCSYQEFTAAIDHVSSLDVVETY